MEREIATIREIEAKRRELPVWEKFETHEEDHAKASMDPPPKMANMSPMWFTANMEYGRFQLNNRGFPEKQETAGADCASTEQQQQQQQHGELNPPQSAARPQSDGAQSYLSAGEETTRNETMTGQEQQEQERVQTGVRTLQPIDPKYMAASRRGNRDEEAGTNRLTTGYAKQWMSSERQRFWDNIQEVAPVAGYDVSPKSRESGSTRQSSESQVLKVE